MPGKAARVCPVEPGRRHQKRVKRPPRGPRFFSPALGGPAPQFALGVRIVPITRSFLPPPNPCHRVSCTVPHLLPLSLGLLERRALNSDSCVVHQNIDRAESFLYLVIDDDDDDARRKAKQKSSDGGQGARGKTYRRTRRKKSANSCFAHRLQE